MISQNALEIIKNGEVRTKVQRAGMSQFLIFKVKRVRLGETTFVELFVDRVVNIDEILRLANELGLPVESQNGRAFPEGKSANDFAGL